GRRPLRIKARDTSRVRTIGQKHYIERIFVGADLGEGISIHCTLELFSCPQDDGGAEAELRFDLLLYEIWQLGREWGRCTKKNVSALNEGGDVVTARFNEQGDQAVHRKLMLPADVDSPQQRYLL